MFMGNAVYRKSLKSWWVTGWMTALFFASATAYLQSYFCMHVHTNTDAQKNLRAHVFPRNLYPFSCRIPPASKSPVVLWVSASADTRSQKRWENPSEIPDTAAAVSQQRQTNKEDELREYRRKEMKTKIETWKCFVPAINKFGHVYILSYPCHVKVITSLRTLWHKISSMLAKRFLGSLLLIKHHKEKTNENSD